jgi:hypothetical protein
MTSFSRPLWCYEWQEKIRADQKVYEAISKPRLRPEIYVASLFKMLTDYRVCCAFSSACALLSDLIRGFEMTSWENAM